jgi:hypothetical protein
MYGERQRVGESMPAWQDDRERQLRVLEAENRELRRQLTALREGIGIALVIEGRVLPLAPSAPPPVAPVAAHPANTMPAGWPPAAEPSYSWPTPRRAADPASAAAPRFGSLAETPEQLPAVRPVAERYAATPPAPQVNPSGAWADSPTTWLRSAPRPAASAQAPKAPVRQTTSPGHPLWKPPHQQPATRNPYADSFLL